MAQAELVDLIHRYYPAGLHESEPAYTASPQVQRLANARREAIEHRAPWDRFLERSRVALPVARIDDWSFRLQAGHDACYQARIDPAGHPAPVPRRDEVVVLPARLLFLRLPDLQYRNLAFGEVRLVDCLFLPSRW